MCGRLYSIWKMFSFKKLGWFKIVCNLIWKVSKLTRKWHKWTPQSTSCLGSFVRWLTMNKTIDIDYNTDISHSLYLYCRVLWNLSALCRCASCEAYPSSSIHTYVTPSAWGRSWQNSITSIDIDWPINIDWPIPFTSRIIRTSLCR